MWAYVEAMRLELDAADKEIERLTSSATASGKPAWIASADRVPDTWAYCLVWDGHDVWQASYQLKDGGSNGRIAGKWYDLHDGLDLVGITHWMPMPEGPK
jgi:hypothetical protein